MGCSLSTPGILHNSKTRYLSELHIEERKEGEISLKENSPVCGIVVNTQNASKPKKPEDDTNEEYIWLVKSYFDRDIEQLQENGYVCSSNAYSSYMYFRKLRNSKKV